MWYCYLSYLFDDELDLLRFSFVLSTLVVGPTFLLLRLPLEALGLRRLGVEPRARPGTVRDGAKEKDVAVLK